MKDYDAILKNLECIILKIQELTSFDNLSSKSAGKSKEYGMKMKEYIEELVETNEGISKYENWLTSKESSLRWNAALNLFPLFPKRCLKVLLDCEKKCTDSLKKASMNAVIKAYSLSFEDDNVFYRNLKNLYKVEDLSLISREYAE